MKELELAAIFNGQGYWVRHEGRILGKGVTEKDLEAQGFSKSELRKLVTCNILMKFQVRKNGGLRNTYVFPIQGGEDHASTSGSHDHQPI